MSKKILVAPLDWGLGHATRCIPVIKQLQRSGCNVTIAVSGSIKTLLTKEFPGISTINLNGYNIQYSTQKRFLPLKILVQAPKIMLSIRREHKWLQKLVKEQGFDAVISDNRFGLYTTLVPCVFITHQLLIQAPFSWLQNLIQTINYKFINRFTQCWVPDFKSGATIAGKLSHPEKLPSIPVKYLGILSRFGDIPPQPVKYNWMVILSGPEPQRTILEKKIVAILPNLPGNALLVRGKPGSDENIIVIANCTVVNHLSTTEMLQALAQSEIIVSRCGYTTVMEMLSLGKKTILIPTPGQTEQEYLAKHLLQQSWCYSCLQDDDLAAHFSTAKNFEYKLPHLAKTSLEEVINKFIAE